MRLLRKLALIAGIGWSIGAFAAQLPPPPHSFVVDEVGVLDTKVVQSLQSLFAAHEKATTDQIVVAIFKSLQDEDLVTRTNEIFQHWQIGKKGKDNGVLLALYWKDRKARIEVGYGLEPELTDAKSKRILSEELIPQLKAGNPNEGLTRASYAILQTLKSPALDKQGVRPPHPNQTQSMPFWVALLVFGLIFVVLILRGLFAGGLGDFRFGWRRTSRSPNRRSNWEIGSSDWDRPSKKGWNDDNSFRGGGGSSGGGGANDSW